MTKHIVILALLAFSTSSFAGGNSTYEFLRLDISPRASAIGGNFIAMIDDPILLFHNPAGLSTLKTASAAIGFFKHLLDINLGYGAYSTELKELGKIGIGLIYINYGSFDQTDRYGNQLGAFSAGELALVIGLSNTHEGLKYGFSSKLIYSSIAGVRSLAIAFDFGLLYIFKEQNLNMGFTISNFGTQLEKYLSLKEELPFEIKFALSKKVEHLPLQLTIGLNKINEPTSKVVERIKNFTIGGEFYITENLDLRFGYNNERRQEMKFISPLDLTGFSFGVGIRVQKYRFDYSLTSLGKIGSLHQIGLTLKI